MLKKAASAAAAILACWLGGSGLRADEIRLKDGTIIHGQVVAELGGRLFIQTSDETLVQVPKDQVKEILAPKPVRATGPVDPTEVKPKTGPTDRTLAPIPAPVTKPAVPSEIEKRVRWLTWEQSPAKFKETEPEIIAEVSGVASAHLSFLHWFAAESLRSGRTLACCVVLRSIGQSKQPDSAGILLPFLEHSDPLVRAAAVQGAGRLFDPRLVGHLSRALVDTELAVGQAAIDALIPAEAEGIDVRSAVLALTQDRDEGKRQRTLAFLTRLGSDWAVARLVELLDDPSPAMRLEALRAIEPHVARIDLQAVFRRLDDSDREVKLQACILSGRTGSKEGVPHLIFVLGQGDEQVALAAADALKKLTSKSFGTDQAKWMEWWDAESRKSNPPDRNP